MDIKTAVRLEFLLLGSNAAGTDQLPTLHLLGWGGELNAAGM